MKLHPVLFALLAYGLAALISIFVTFIVRIIARSVQRKNNSDKPPSGQVKKDGAVP